VTYGDWLPLVNTIGLGAIAYLLLTRVEARLGRVEASVNRMVQTSLLLLISQEGVADAVKDEARRILREITNGNGKRD
jgi:hypothetical protein